MSDPLASELTILLRNLQSEYDVLPFLQERPGEPMWIALAAPPDAAAEIVLYRAEADGRHYIVAPIASSAG